MHHGLDGGDHHPGRQLRIGHPDPGQPVEQAGGGLHQRRLRLVQLGQEVKQGELLADGAATASGELALGKNLLANPGVEKADFELWSTAVSAVNGCGMCLDAHEAELKKHQVPTASIQAALRIAAVIHAVSRVTEAEQALAA